VPAATPIPRAPTILILDSPAALLTRPGCPVCRYADEASDRYLAWFALEAHAQADTITRLCASLGMCPPHTRSLMRQPGAEVRLTAVYRYLMRAARDRLTGPAARPGRRAAARLSRCPACDHDREAAGRAVDTLIDGLADNLIRERYLELGGLCVPHLRVASARAGNGHSRPVAAWLADAVMATVSSRPASPVWLAGTDRDAHERAALRQANPAAASPGPAECAGCLAAARSESSGLAQILRTRDRRLLCAGHLNDLIVLAGQSGVASLLAWQADCVPRGRRAVSLDRCPVCQAAEVAIQQAIADLRGWLRASRQLPGCQVPLCVRHLLVLRTVDPWAGRVTGPGGAERADTLAAELDEAFGKNTWTHRLEARGPEMTAWRRAVAFLDGGVFGGCAARQICGHLAP
jgi:hypothetical protein